jgi:UDP-glucose 4-epimerase
MSSYKVLVLGSNGFIGKNIVEFLSDKEYIVLSPKRNELNLLDTKNVYDFIDKHKPDIVIHTAVNINSLIDNLRIYFNLERCSDNFGRMLTIGSGAEYDIKSYKPLMTEEYFLENIPSDIYGMSKFVASRDIEKNPRNIINFRVFGIFGKYEDYTRRFISNNICRAIGGFGISMNKNMKFDFLDVNDFLKILEMFFTKDLKHTNYNICTGKPVEFKEIAEIINNIHENGKGKIKIIESGLNPEYSGDNSRFLEEFGSFNFTDLNSSVEDLYKWYKESPDIIKFCEKLN